MSDPRQLPFFSRHFGKIATGIIVALPLWWMMGTHLDYTNEEHKSPENPGSYLAYGLNKANNDAGNAATSLGEFSDKVTATIKGQPIPQKEDPVPLYQRSPTLRDFYVNVCVPRNLVEENSWENPAPGSKMEAFNHMIRDFILATGDRSIQYRIRDGAFEKFDASWPGKPEAYLAEVDARQPCPPSNYGYKVLVPAR